MSNNPVRKNVNACKVRTFVWNFKKNTEVSEKFLRLEKLFRVFNALVKVERQF